MKFICDKTDLSNSLATVSRTAAVKSAIPALEGILAIAEKSELKLTGYNLETGIQTVINANVTEIGSIVFPTRLFSEIVRKLPDDQVIINVGEDMMIHIECGVSSFNIMGISPEDYPEIPTVEARQGFEAERALIGEMIGSTVFAVSTNENKPIHTGCLFEVAGNELNVVAIDGYRLALRKELIHNLNNDSYKFVVPGNALKEVERIAGESDELMKTSVGARHVMFEIGNTVLISRLLDGNFIDYKAAIPKAAKYEIIADKDKMIEAVDRVSLLTNDKLKNPVLCVFEDQVVQLSCTASLGRAYDECQIEGNAQGLKIGFNNRYLLDALRACDQTEIIVKLTSGESPCLIVPKEDDHFLYMILPIRLRG